jgi:hypothetical protein
MAINSRRSRCTGSAGNQSLRKKGPRDVPPRIRTQGMMVSMQAILRGLGYDVNCNLRMD